jgi:hypothetical protein
MGKGLKKKAQMWIPDNYCQRCIMVFRFLLQQKL